MADLNAANTSYHLAKSVRVLDAVNWIANSENLLQSEKCFAKAGFTEMQKDECSIMEEAQDIIARISPLCQRNISCDNPEP